MSVINENQSSIVKEKYIAYYRKSPGGNKTESELKEALGIDAQKYSVKRFLESVNGEVIACYEDMESGKKDNRPQLILALEQCQRLNATLIIARLDRLSRSVSFISKLMDAGIKFKCCDMPFADNFTIHLFAALAQKERERISNNTKLALGELKKRGIKLGSPKNNMTLETASKGWETNSRKALENSNNKFATGHAKLLRRDGLTFHKIAIELNNLGIKTSKGKMFGASQVKILLDRANAINLVPLWVVSRYAVVS